MARAFDASRKEAALAKLARQRLAGRVAPDAPMSAATSFGIGGPADILVRPACVQDIVKVVRLCRRERYPLVTLGGGTNVLVLDGGIRGVVMMLGGQLSELRRQSGKIYAGAGARLMDAARFAQSAGLTGIEFACGIPGSVGGGVCMNAGAYGREMKDIVARSVFIGEDGEVGAADAAAHAFGYRSSWFLGGAGGGNMSGGKAGGGGANAIIIETEFDLTQGDPAAIQVVMDELDARRSSSQPLDLPSAGSVFRRPEGAHVGPMVEACGLKGYAVGGAQVSEMHSGFIVNRGGATARDVRSVIAHVQEAVQARFGVLLDTELRVIGEDTA